MIYSSSGREKEREKLSFIKHRLLNDICWREEAFNLFHCDNAART